MRIQHNIMAMNSYRNFSNNTKALSKNLEKLSSGYRINRAGDDAAGLAISEKMRAQITGLKAAQKNAKDGISLIQTAEGSLTEVHSMLNRMLDLADQSANGTYDNETDRMNLQKEVTQLSSEIDRIADSTNFNGIKLLDGSLATSGAGGAGGAGGAVNLETELNGAEMTFKDVAATKGSYTTDAFDPAALTNGSTMDVTFTMDNGKSVSIQLTRKDYTDGTDGGELFDKDGNVVGKFGDRTGVTEAELSKALKGALTNTEVGKNFKIAANANGSLTFTNTEAGADAPELLKDASIRMLDASGNQVGNSTVVEFGAANRRPGKDAYQTIDGSQFTNASYDGTDNTVLNINGKKFAIIVDQATSGATADLIKKATENGLEVIHVGAVDENAGTGAAVGDGDLNLDATGADEIEANAAAGLQGDVIAAALSKALGYDVSFVRATGTAGDPDAVASHFAFKKDNSINPGNKAGGGLTLQIGDTSDSFNQLKVSIEDMHTKALGIDKLNVGEQEGASAAVEVIKSAINSVSATRGTLGALQNRLDHTINNLSVMHENIQDAEASIRDVDVAEEMMSYTKNNILVQSAQAMLAQANQVPQGVLQLLQ